MKRSALVLTIVAALCYSFESIGQEIVDLDGKPVSRDGSSSVVLKLTPEKIREAIKVGQLKDPQTILFYPVYQDETQEGAILSVGFSTPYLRVMHESSMSSRKGIFIDESRLPKSILAPEAWVHISVRRQADTFTIEHVAVAKIGGNSPSDFVQPLSMAKPEAYSFDAEGTDVLESRSTMAIFPLAAIKEGWEVRVILGSGEVLKAPLTAKALKNAW